MSEPWVVIREIEQVAGAAPASLPGLGKTGAFCRNHQAEQLSTNPRAQSGGRDA